MGEFAEAEEVDVRISKITTSRQILTFALPTILMVLVISSFSLVDGLVISNYVDTDALAALTLAMPILGIMTAIGFMFTAGGSATINKKIGENKLDEAAGDFTTIFIFAIGISLVIALIGTVFIDQIVDLLGSDAKLHDTVKSYAYIAFLSAPVYLLDLFALEFMIAAGRPTFSLILALVGGTVNIALDLFFVISCGMGLAGASLASSLAAMIPSAVGLLFFTFCKSSPLRFAKPTRSLKVVAYASANGSSELFTELSGAVSSIIFNVLVMQHAGADGVASYVIVAFVQAIATSLIAGYSLGVSPVMSYNYGKQDREIMSRLFSVSIRFIIVISVIMVVLLEIFASAVISLFVTNDTEEVVKNALYGLRVFAPALVLLGITVYASSLFTSLSNAVLSAFISLLAVFIVLIPILYVFINWLGIDGIWWANDLSYLISFTVALYLFDKNKERYGYSTSLKETFNFFHKC